jgi:hypothetical protein
MDSCELMDQVEGILREAEESLEDATEVSSATVCRTMVSCTRAICHEIAALRRVVNSIDYDVTNIDFKIADQN